MVLRVTAHKPSICLGILKTDQWKPSTKMVNGQSSQFSLPQELTLQS